jgi:hypothetical protein
VAYDEDTGKDDYIRFAAQSNKAPPSLPTSGFASSMHLRMCGQGGFRDLVEAREKHRTAAKRAYFAGNILSCARRPSLAYFSVSSMASRYVSVARLAPP